MSGKSTIARDPVAKKVADAQLKSGATVEETTRAINRQTKKKVSRSAVGRYRQRLESWLEIKAENDALIQAMAESDRMDISGLLMLARSAALHLLKQANEGTVQADDVAKLVSTLLNVERVEEIQDKRVERVAAAECARLREKAQQELQDSLPKEILEEVIARVYG